MSVPRLPPPKPPGPIVEVRVVPISTFDELAAPGGVLDGVIAYKTKTIGVLVLEDEVLEQLPETD